MGTYFWKKKIVSWPAGNTSPKPIQIWDPVCPISQELNYRFSINVSLKVRPTVHMENVKWKTSNTAVAYHLSNCLLIFCLLAIASFYVYSPISSFWLHKVPANLYEPLVLHGYPQLKLNVHSTIPKSLQSAKALCNYDIMKYFWSENCDFQEEWVKNLNFAI